MSCGVGHRLGSDPTLLWLCRRPRPVATASIPPLAWEPPYAVSAALKKDEKRLKRKEKKKTILKEKENLHLSNVTKKIY